MEFSCVWCWICINKILAMFDQCSFFCICQIHIYSLFFYLFHLISIVWCVYVITVSPLCDGWSLFWDTLTQWTCYTHSTIHLAVFTEWKIYSTLKLWLFTKYTQHYSLECLLNRPYTRVWSVHWRITYLTLYLKVFSLGYVK